ncbi:MAG: xylulokinase, partial [Planctomycetes bacterium]|nr:xylulokinase [Planctomycetota bacterium]
LKAIMESVTFYFVDSIHALAGMGIDTSELVATGGGAKSDAWLQIKADIFGVPFIRPRITECGILGAAILAGASTGVFADAAEGVAQFVQQERIFEPDAKRHETYRDLHDKYRRLYPALKDLLGEL